jgi:hypothetical protein
MTSGNNAFYQSDEWRAQRQRILDRWDGMCWRCGCFTKTPHIHHFYGLKANAYEVLCPDCHAELHGKQEIRRFGNGVSYCRYCGEPIQWGQIDGQWKPLQNDLMGLHKCLRDFETGQPSTG